MFCVVCELLLRVLVIVFRFLCCVGVRSTRLVQPRPKLVSVEFSIQCHAEDLLPDDRLAILGMHVQRRQVKYCDSPII